MIDDGARIIQVLDISDDSVGRAACFLSLISKRFALELDDLF